MTATSPSPARAAAGAPARPRRRRGAGGARRPLAQRRAGALPGRGPARARRRSPSTRCAGSAPPQARARAARAEDAAAGGRCAAAGRAGAALAAGRAALRRAHAGRPGGRRGARSARRAAPASSTPCCGASCASATRSSPRRCADPLARFNHPPWWIERLRADWPEHWQAIARRRQPASADDPARQRPARQRRRPTSRGSPTHGHRAHAPSAAQAVALARPLPGDAAARLRRRATSRCRTPPRSAPRRCCSAPAARARARACSTPAPRPAARPRTCSSWPISTCWRSTATPAAWRASTRRSPASACARRDPCRRRRRRRPPGGTAAPSTRSCSTRRAAPRASCAAIPTCAGCAAPSDIAALAATQARLLDALWPLLAPGRPAALLHLLGVQGRGPGRRSTLFCNASGDAGPSPQPAFARPPAAAARQSTTTHAAARLRAAGGRLLPTPCSRRPAVHADDRPPMTPLPPHGSLRRRSVLRALGVAASRLLLPGVWLAAVGRAAPARAADAELTALRGRPRRGRRASSATPSTSSCRAASTTR